VTSSTTSSCATRRATSSASADLRLRRPRNDRPSAALGLPAEHGLGVDAAELGRIAAGVDPGDVTSLDDEADGGVVGAADTQRTAHDLESRGRFLILRLRRRQGPDGLPLTPWDGSGGLAGLSEVRVHLSVVTLALGKEVATDDVALVGEKLH
jgi:hypothetical protein